MDDSNRENGPGWRKPANFVVCDDALPFYLLTLYILQFLIERMDAIGFYTVTQWWAQAFVLWQFCLADRSDVYIAMTDD